MPSFGKRSRENLDTCDVKLQELLEEVVRKYDCSVTCGHRGEDAQMEAYSTGKSKAQWGQSKHNSKPSKAVDVIPYPVDWDDINRFHHFAGYVQGVAMMMDIKIKWGGDFKDFFDGPHFELG